MKRIIQAVHMMCAIAAGMVILVPVANGQSQPNLPLTLICTDLKGTSAGVGPTFPKNGELVEDGFANGILTISLRTVRKNVQAGVVFLDAAGNAKDTAKYGAKVEFKVLDRENGITSVLSRYDHDNVEERFVFQLGGNKKFPVVMTQQKLILGNWRTGIFVGTCTVG